MIEQQDAARVIAIAKRRAEISDELRRLASELHKIKQRKYRMQDKDPSLNLLKEYKANGPTPVAFLQEEYAHPFDPVNDAIGPGDFDD